MDLFSHITPEPIEPKSNKTLNERIKEPRKYKNELTVKTLSQSAIQKFRDQGEEVIETENGIIIKY